MKFNLNTESINYIKITYKDSNAFAHCIKAVVRYIGENEILVCTKFGGNRDINYPQEVSLGIACDNGLYKAVSELKKVTYEPPYLLFTIQKPEDMEYQQKREYFRVRLQENVSILYETDGQEITHSAITYDISANGVRVELDNIRVFPEEVNLLIFLPKKTINVKAKYVRNDDEDKIIKASFRFEDISQQDLDYISQFCLQKQLEERRKNLM